MNNSDSVEIVKTSPITLDSVCIKTKAYENIEILRHLFLKWDSEGQINLKSLHSYVFLDKEGTIKVFAGKRTGLFFRDSEKQKFIPRFSKCYLKISKDGELEISHYKGGEINDKKQKKILKLIEGLQPLRLRWNLQAEQEEENEKKLYLRIVSLKNCHSPLLIQVSHEMQIYGDNFIKGCKVVAKNLNKDIETICEDNENHPLQSLQEAAVKFGW